ncbi:MAG TPA: tRNA preQ1(34) S-adenosylmethionine ribosyltransferase-isomerase QueA [Blastocatellia bacterium]|nr:tRNA preQ1(34) S-adenosylmethionine ribosyltransferase-isomerase QueA [Blastocatellia bacterium]
MRVADFDFELPEHLIAQEPEAGRDLSRLLVIDRAKRTLSDTIFARLPDYLAPGDLLLLNNTRVFPARLIGNRLRSEEGPGGRVEIFLARRVEPLVWEALVRPGKALLPGARAQFAGGRLKAEVIERRELGRRVVRFDAASDEELDRLIDEIGRTPLPPYIKRDEDDRLDVERYQTVFARERGAIAAPTAGLHFSPRLLESLRGRGVEIVEITLHVGYGTFQPVRVERVEDHRVEAEAYSISPDAAARINRALVEKRRILAVGTTTTRALESACREGARGPGRRPEAGPVAPASLAMTDLFIYPGFEFRALGGLITNFHLPRSSLLMLVAAFAGKGLILDAYRHAIGHGYRFYSYGDATLII